MAKNVLVTGGSGRLGNYVCSHLKKEGCNVSSFDAAPPPPESDNVKEGIPFVQGDLLDLGDCLRAIAFAQPDVIVHLAAITGPTELLSPYGEKAALAKSPFRYTQRRPEDDCMKINTMGTFYVLDAARRMNIKDVIISSSYYATGIGGRWSGTTYTPQYLPVDEEHPCDPESTYALSKYLDEEIGKAFARAYGMKIIALRYMGVFYENNEGSRKLYKFGVNVEPADDKNKGLMVDNTYQYVDARDIANITELCIQKIRDSALKPFEAFFVSTDTTYLEDTEEVITKRWPFIKDLGKNMKGTEGIFSIAKAEKLLGYKPAYSWRNN
ncbi:MAG: NAD(P)-dependent oxidoreductase [Treponema sp.]|jgi:nucleoside-diphosphate-sugar epimerase|nr:NAD(P)-dependent oxidoreductase [Treponema sp.]